MHEISIEQRVIYLHRLLQDYGMLTLPLGSGLSFSLPLTFQPLRLRQSVADEPKEPAHENDTITDDVDDEAEKRTVVVDVLVDNGTEALKQSPHGCIVILGGPGTGKTTVLKHLLYHQAQLALDDHDAQLPIFLSLPDLARTRQNLDAYLTQYASTMGLNIDLAQAVRHGRAFVCMDSLDEVLPRLRAGVIRQINQWAQSNDNTWVVGSRFTDYKGGQFQHGQFQEWELQPLDEQRRLRLATQLLPELQKQSNVSAQFLTPPDADDYIKRLSEHQQAATWGSNPLLFSLGAVVYLRRGSLSGSRATLYREVLDALLETRGGDTSLRNVLADVALALYQIKGRTFTLDELHEVLVQVNIALRTGWIIEEMRYQVLNSGVLDVVATQTYSFRHQTFQEYLVALALARRFMSEDEQIREQAQQIAWNKHTYSRWNEVERLLVGILVQDYGGDGLLQAQTWLYRLLQQRSSVAGDPGNLSLELAIKALGEVAQLDDWQVEGTHALEEMAAIRWVEEAQRFSGRAARAYRDRQYERYLTMAADIGHLSPTAQQKAAELLLKTLLNDSHSHIYRLLGAIRSSYITDYLLNALKRYPDQLHQRSIKEVFEYLGEFAPIDFLLNELGSREHECISNAERTLIRLALYVPPEKLVPILKMSGYGRAKAAENILCAIAKRKALPVEELLAVLGGGQKDAAFHAACVLAVVQHPGAFDLLLLHLNDKQLPRRLNTLQALGHYKSRVPLDRMITMLGDKDSSVRRGVVDVLAQYGSVMPVELLVLAAHDASPQVRMRAVEGLGTLGDLAPLAVLMQAVGDQHFFVAETAIRVLGTLGDRTPVRSLLGFLPQQSLMSTILEVLSNKQMAKHVPVELLLDLYEKNWQGRRVILSAISGMGYAVAHTFLLDELCNEYIFTGHSAAIQLLRQKDAMRFFIEQVEVIIDRCYLPYKRAIAILGCRQDYSSIEALLKGLADDRWRVSEAAAEELCKRADAIAQADILALLTHKSTWVRKNVLLILDERVDLPPLESLLVALHDGNYEVREGSAKLLGKYGDDAPLDELLAATLDNSIEVCRQAAVSLSRSGRRDPALAVTGVMNLLRQEVAANQWMEWAEMDAVRAASEEISNFAPVELLLQIMYDAERVVSRVAADMLRLMGERIPIERLVHALNDQNENVRRAAAFALSMTGERAPVEALINALPKKNAYNEQSQEVIETLTLVSKYGGVPDEIFLQSIFKKHHYGTYAPLFRAFTAQKKRIPEEIVVDALAHFPHNDIDIVLQYLCQFVELLPMFPERIIVEALALYDSHQRYYAEPDPEGIIRQLLPKISVDSLLKTLVHRKSKIRIGTLGLLAVYPGEVSMEAILLAFQDLDGQVRRAAIECVQKRPEGLPVQAIVDCLQDNNERVCKEAITALASLGLLAPVPDIMAMLDAPSAEVRWAAVHALVQPGLIERTPIDVFINALGEHYDGEVQGVILEALYSKDPHSAAEHCIVALGSDDEELALVAFKLLEQIDPTILPEIVQEAIGLFQGGKPGRFFRTLSVGLFAELVGVVDQAPPELIGRLGDLLDWPYWEVCMKAA